MHQTAQLFDLPEFKRRSQAGKKKRQPSDGWCELATEKLRMFARAHGGVFLIEHARWGIGRLVPQPDDLRKWGKVTSMALKRGYIEHVPRHAGFPAASSNGATKHVYRKGPKA